MSEIKETITKGQAMDIADAIKFNKDVKAVSVNGNEPWGSDKNSFKPKRTEVTLDKDIDYLDMDINGIYGYKDSSFKQSLYVTTQRHDDGIAVNGYAGHERSNRENRESSNFSIYFNNREQVIKFAEQCLNMLLIANEETALINRYSGNWLDGKHPEVMDHFPNLLDKTKCETGRYYWDGSLNKTVKITKSTSQDILDEHNSYDVDDDGNFEPDWENERAEGVLEGLMLGLDANWNGEQWQGIRLGELQVGVGQGYRSNGISREKVKNPEDKRRKQWVTTFHYQDGTTDTMIGYWVITNSGVLTRNTYQENK